ncbi:trypsin-like serine peptidase [Streptomyces yaizuensis]|uniref:Lipoprotein n=1 Tax=Streptomyces yaizuensis TaxID=2989713 RepID=A0ABQ5PBD5_9ACTN|nr:hypothetical protein [Streptomyces sp. YSPA8]GLF99546.1 lipoprotein [Streptomyces sp. YSPA8]
MRSVRLALAATAISVISMIGFVQPASAGDDARDRRAPADTIARSAAQQQNGPAAVERAKAYWTPERIKRVLSRPAADAGAAAARDTRAPGAAAGQRRTPDGPAGSVPSTAPTVRGSKNLAGPLANTGLVLFRTPAGNQSWCTASAVTSPSRMMVVTAGHCVVEGGSGSRPGGARWMRDWVYLPAYHGATPLPYGYFPAKEFTAFNGWINNTDFNYDIAMVTLHPNGAGRVGDVTGTNGLAWNWSMQEYLSAVGYPDNIQNGEYQQFCSGHTSSSLVDPAKLQLQCHFGGGASGGPWLMNFNGISGEINGVSILLRSDGFNESPYFDTKVYDMWLTQGVRT